MEIKVVTLILFLFMVLGTTMWAEATLISEWRLNEASGITVPDTTANNHGMLIGEVNWSKDFPRNLGLSHSIDFKSSVGKDSYIDFGTNSVLAPSSMTLTFWAKANGIHSGQVLISKYSSSPGSYEIGFESSAQHRLYFRYWDSSSSNTERHVGLTAPAPYTAAQFDDRKWHHFAATVDYITGESRLYVDGVLIESISTEVNTGIHTTSQPLVAGRRSVGGSESPYNGRLSYIRIYNAALTNDEIQAHIPYEPYLVGVYMYEYAMNQVAVSLGKSYKDFINEHMCVLRDHGVNFVYLGGASRERFPVNLELAQKHGIKLIPQLDFAYFQPDWDDKTLEANARTAGTFIDQYYDNPNILAWSVMEEVGPASVDRLAQYYTRILSYAPGARFNLCHVSTEAAVNQPPPYPEGIGGIVYRFLWVQDTLLSPAAALDLTYTVAGVYAKEAERRKADFALVVTQGGYAMPAIANQMAKDPKPADPLLQQKILTFADEGRMGWKKYNIDGTDYYTFWKFYRTPGNCMKALAWIGLMQGAGEFSVWHYTPPGKFPHYTGHPSPPTDINSSLKSTADLAIVEYNHWTLAGKPGMTRPELTELAVAAKEIRQYGRIPGLMVRQDTPIKTHQDRIYCNAFTVPGVSGTILVIQNSNVGKWPHNSADSFSEKDQIFINDDGTLRGYVPFTSPQKITFEFNDGTKPMVIDLLSGSEITFSGGKHLAQIAPGSGKLFFVGSKQEAKKLIQLMRNAA